MSKPQVTVDETKREVTLHLEAVNVTVSFVTFRQLMREGGGIEAASQVLGINLEPVSHVFASTQDEPVA